MIHTLPIRVKPGKVRVQRAVEVKVQLPDDLLVHDGLEFASEESMFTRGLGGGTLEFAMQKVGTQTLRQHLYLALCCLIGLHNT